MNLISTRGSGATIQEGRLFEGATIREDMVCIHSFIPPPHWIFPKKPWFGRGWAISPKAGGMENAGGGDGWFFLFDIKKIVHLVLKKKLLIFTCRGLPWFIYNLFYFESWLKYIDIYVCVILLYICIYYMTKFDKYIKTLYNNFIHHFCLIKTSKIRIRLIIVL